jgi:hypothetical protein
MDFRLPAMNALPGLQRIPVPVVPWMHRYEGEDHMVTVKRIVLDVLKPHQPNALEFSLSIAAVGADYVVRLTVIEVDENTETLRMEIEGGAIDFEAVHTSINTMGGSLHSIDEVEVRNETDNG